MLPPGFLCAQCTSMTLCIGSYSVDDPLYWFLFCNSLWKAKLALNTPKTGWFFLLII